MRIVVRARPARLPMVVAGAALLGCFGMTLGAASAQAATVTLKQHPSVPCGPGCGSTTPYAELRVQAAPGELNRLTIEGGVTETEILVSDMVVPVTAVGAGCSQRSPWTVACSNTVGATRQFTTLKVDSGDGGDSLTVGSTPVRVIRGSLGKGNDRLDTRGYTSIGNALFAEPVSPHYHGVDPADRFSGGPGDDVLLGGDAPDMLTGGGGRDIVRGGGGGDIVADGDSGSGDSDALDGEVIDYDQRTVGIVAYVGAPTMGAPGELDRVSGYGTIVSGRGADLLVGGGGPDRLNGGGGGDQIIGRGGDDSLSLSETDGDARGSNRVFGGQGADTVDVIGQSGTLLDGGPGADKLYGGVGRDRILGGGGNDTAFGDVQGTLALEASNGAGDLIDGGPGEDSLDGQYGNDTIRGGPGADEVIGSADRDRLFGGPGADLVNSFEGENATGAPREGPNCGAGRDVLDSDIEDLAGRNCERLNIFTLAVSGAALRPSRRRNRLRMRIRCATRGVPKRRGCKARLEVRTQSGRSQLARRRLRIARGRSRQLVIALPRRHRRVRVQFEQPDYPDPLGFTVALRR